MKPSPTITFLLSRERTTTCCCCTRKRRTIIGLPGLRALEFHECYPAGWNVGDPMAVSA